MENAKAVIVKAMENVLTHMEQSPQAMDELSAVLYTLCKCISVLEGGLDER